MGVRVVQAAATGSPPALPPPPRKNTFFTNKLFFWESFIIQPCGISRRKVSIMPREQ